MRFLSEEARILCLQQYTAMPAAKTTIKATTIPDAVQ